MQAAVQLMASLIMAALSAQRTEVKFDLVSPVDELARQIRLEFDFLHEARTMDAISQNLKVSRGLLHAVLYLTSSVFMQAAANGKCCRLLLVKLCWAGTFYVSCDLIFVQQQKRASRILCHAKTIHTPAMHAVVCSGVRNPFNVMSQRACVRLW